MAKIYTLPTVEKARKKAAKPEPLAHQWTCDRCLKETGVATSEIVKIKLSPLIKALRVTGGSDRWCCAHCWRRGHTTPVIR